MGGGGLDIDQVYATFFKNSDKNSDGKLTLLEVEAYLEKHEKDSHASHEKFLKAVGRLYKDHDSDKDTFLSLNEFKAFAKAMEEDKEMKELDKDREDVHMKDEL